MKNCLFLLFIWCLTPFLSTAQDAAQFRQAAQEALAAYGVPGFALGVIKDGEVVLSEGFGVRTAGKAPQVDEHTLFAIASNTKAFISTSIVKLHLEGKLDLDAPVRDYLPFFALYDPYVSEHVVVRDLLCHRVGLGTFSGDVIWYKSDMSSEEVVRRIRHVPQAYEFRMGYGYTNLMFITAGEVIKAVTGQSWDQYVQENFLEPLGMNRTQTTVRNLTSMDNVANPHHTRFGNQPIPYVNWDNMGAAGGIVSSVHDMLLWMKVQLNNGQYGDYEIFPKDVTKITWRPHNTFGNANNFAAAGLGWFVSNSDGNTVVNHGGGYDGMYSQVRMVPGENLGVVVLTNSMTGLSSQLANYIVRSYLDQDTENWLGKAIERQQRGQKSWDDRYEGYVNQRLANTEPTLDDKQIVGKYNDPMFGEIEVSRVGEQLLLNFSTAQRLNATLKHWHYDTYQIVWNETHAWFDFGLLSFVTDNNHQVTGLRFDVPNDDIFFDEIGAEKIQE